MPLKKLQTSSKMIMILKAMYNCVKSCVRWGANLSQFFECPQGVKQGCLFSPLIFSLLISEVAEFGKWKAWNSITTKARRNIPFIIRRRYCPSILLGINELGVNKRFQPENATNTCPICPGVLKDEIHFLFICPVYAGVRHKYLREFTDNDVEPSLNSVFENPSTDANRKVSMFAFYALKHGEEILAS